LWTCEKFENFLNTGEKAKDHMADVIPGITDRGLLIPLDGPLLKNVALAGQLTSPRGEN
jgi:hypothetical protein